MLAKAACLHISIPNLILVLFVINLGLGSNIRRAGFERAGTRAGSRRAERQPKQNQATANPAVMPMTMIKGSKDVNLKTLEDGGVTL